MSEGTQVSVRHEEDDAKLVAEVTILAGITYRLEFHLEGGVRTWDFYINDEIARTFSNGESLSQMSRQLREYSLPWFTMTDLYYGIRDHEAYLQVARPDRYDMTEGDDLVEDRWDWHDPRSWLPTLQGFGRHALTGRRR